MVRYWNKLNDGLRFAQLILLKTVWHIFKEYEAGLNERGVLVIDRSTESQITTVMTITHQSAVVAKIADILLRLAGDLAPQQHRSMPQAQERSLLASCTGISPSTALPMRVSECLFRP